MEPENKPKSTENIQITFKLSPEERQKIIEMAQHLDINVSEYCRIKCIADEKTVFNQITKAAELEKENKILKVKLAYYKDSERDPNSIVLQLTSLQKELLERLFSDKVNWGDQTLGRKILQGLRYFILYPKIWDELFEEYGDKVDKEDFKNEF